MFQQAAQSSLHSSSKPPSPSLNAPAHVRYWLRCLKTFLPTAYTEQDASRIPLAFFILSALDLLDSLDSHTTQVERAGWIDFIYSCQHPEGGFRAFTGSKFGDKATTAENARWDPANIAGTYFAIVSLALLGDDLERVQRRKTLEWIKRLQHKDGSFGELHAGSGPVEGGQDVRFCFMAALVCYLLGTCSEQDPISQCIDSEALAQFVLASKVGPIPHSSTTSFEELIKDGRATMAALQENLTANLTVRSARFRPCTRPLPWQPE